MAMRQPASAAAAPRADGVARLPAPWRALARFAERQAAQRAPGRREPRHQGDEPRAAAPRRAAHAVRVQLGPRAAGMVEVL
jgi:hypothetical protein